MFEPSLNYHVIIYLHFSNFKTQLQIEYGVHLNRVTQGGSFKTSASKLYLGVLKLQKCFLYLLLHLSSIFFVITIKTDLDFSSTFVTYNI